MELAIIVALLLLPVGLVYLTPRSWPLVSLLGLALAAGWAMWNYSRKDEFDEFYGGLIPTVGGAFLLLWLLGSFVGYRAGRRRNAARTGA